MLEAVQSEKWTPDFNRWAGGAFQWKVPDDVWEQLPEDLLVDPFVEITDVVVQKHHRRVDLMKIQQKEFLEIQAISATIAKRGAYFWKRMDRILVP